MGLTSSLFSGLSGMKTNEFRMDIIGNNISNVNTYAYKSSRASFQNQFLHTFSFGSAPEGTLGGTNPMQVGTGTGVGAVARDFSGGAPETTGRKSDLAIQGQGLFILAKPDGSEVYTRDGSFQFNSENYLLSADGFFLQGYGVDNSFNIVEGQLTNLRIPIGEITTAEQSSYAKFSGDLNANGNVASSRPLLLSQQFYQDNPPVTAADGITALSSLFYADGTNVFSDGNILTSAAIEKGGANIPAEEFIVGETGSTFQELVDWLQDVMGINTSADLPDLTANGVQAPGVTITADGEIQVVGNIGMENNLVIPGKAFTLAQGTGAAVLQDRPFAFDNQTDEDTLGESIRTSFRAYDSLGNPMDINVTMVMVDKTNGITWRYFAESSDDSDFDLDLGTGTVQFDSNGQYLSGQNLVVSIDREGTGAATPQTIELDFSEMDGYAMSSSAMSLLSQDGFQSGTLQDYSIGPDGYITGSFTNGLTRTMGLVVMATFRNYEGLIADADNLYASGPNSGGRIIKKPQELGAGSINSGALELSNVDLSREFINLITTSTGYSANSRVIQTSNQLLNELMTLTR